LPQRRYNDGTMRDAVREHFANRPPGSKLQAAIDFGVDVSMMDPPDYSDRSGYRTDRSFREVLDALFEHQVECIIIGGVALMLHGSTRMTGDIDVRPATKPCWRSRRSSKPTTRERSGSFHSMRSCG
jgi:Nucleotidyltransferase of unknown function (DUF6036)